MRRYSFEAIVDKQYSEWVKKSVLAYEEALLASKYPEYKALVQEYHDGIILYEIMSDKVWNKAVKDTTGLKEFYETQKMKYMWPERLDATVYICASSEISEKVYKLLKKKENYVECRQINCFSFEILTFHHVQSCGCSSPCWWAGRS